MLQEYHTQSSSQAKHLGLDELKNQQLGAVFVPNAMLDDEHVIDVLDQCKHVAFRPIEEKILNENTFDNLDKNDAWSLYSKTHNAWVLKNNLELLENLVPTAKHLTSLWDNERTAFFEELWHLLKKNLGAQSIRVAYNHMQKAKKEGEKNKLIRIVVEGNNKPEPVENKELGEMLFKNYEGKFSDHFTCYDIEESEKSTFLATINDSPVIIMAEMFDMTKIQRSLMMALFDSLQS